MTFFWDIESNFVKRLIYWNMKTDLWRRSIKNWTKLFIFIDLMTCSKWIRVFFHMWIFCLVRIISWARNVFLENWTSSVKLLQFDKKNIWITCERCWSVGSHFPAWQISKSWLGHWCLFSTHLVPPILDLVLLIEGVLWARRGDIWIGQAVWKVVFFVIFAIWLIIWVPHNIPSTRSTKSGTKWELNRHQGPIQLSEICSAGKCEPWNVYCFKSVWPNGEFFSCWLRFLLVCHIHFIDSKIFSKCV